ncbi:restriction endonuclease subunit S [Patescibacteria group bacterium]|nr:restriction endonuclease subunit S [Patescibacteria group bacterium]
MQNQLSNWQKIKLGDACTLVKGVTYKSSDYATSTEGMVFLTLKSIAKGGGFNFDGIKYYKGIASPDQFVSPNDLIIANTDLTRDGDVIGAPLFIPQIDNQDKCVFSMDISKLVTDESKLNREYLYHYLLTQKSRDYMRSISNGSTVLHLNTKQVNNLEIPLPPLDLQSKIANYLFLVDQQIAKTDQIIQKTEALKQGLMQELLTKGIGHKKFKKTKLGEVPEEWKVVDLEDCAKRGSGHTPNKKMPSYWNGGIKWISLSDTKKLDNVYISETDKEISDEGIHHSSAVLHPAGVVVLSRDAGVGKSAITTKPMAVSQHFIVWKCNDDLNSLFLYYLLQNWKPLFENIATGTTIKTIGLPFFKQLQIPLPSLSEQKNISQILLSIDKKIQAKYEYKKALNLLKKGMMHDIFNQKVQIN